MKNELSILIPVYNETCVDLVRRLVVLCHQRTYRVTSFKYEIIVADDASPDRQCVADNEVINRIAHCRFIARETNSGSAAMRNFLGEESRYEWLLFLDCDMQIVSDQFLDAYLDYEHDYGVVNGGIAIGGSKEEYGHNLRYLYEKREEAAHCAEQRGIQPYREFRSTNFLMRRDVMLSCQFDERFKKSGYEDVAFGKALKKANVPIWHIDNPTMMVDFEDNARFMDKIDRSLHTLHTFRNELRGYSRMISIESGIHVGMVKVAIRLWHRLFGGLERRNLCGRHPKLFVFDLYRLGYYIMLTKNDKEK